MGQKVNPTGFRVGVMKTGVAAGTPPSKNLKIF